MTSKYPDFFTDPKTTPISVDKIKDTITEEIVSAFDGPLKHKSVQETMFEILKAEFVGKKHVLILKYIEQYGKSSTSNILIPHLNKDTHEIEPYLIITDPDDAERLARAHIRKQENFVPILADSIISTTDNDHWKKQRHELLPSVSPMHSLRHIFPISLERATITGRLAPSDSIDMLDFFLNETQAQLQLALLGMTPEFEQKTNKAIRTAFAGRGPKGYVRTFAFELLQEIEKGKDVAKDTATSTSTRPGPMSVALQSVPSTDTEHYGNAVLLAFAGHDTTGITLTWLLFELCRHPTFQDRLMDEIDRFNSTTEPTYENIMIELPFMTRCITETLRLWPAVANGTFRRLDHDDYVTGSEAERRKMPTGTRIQIMNLSRHRSKLWGADRNTFNPDRTFEDDELWTHRYNPSSKRFSPFTYGPRDCLGKNFAHMEMKLILLNVFKQYRFELSDKQKEFDNSAYMGINRATLAPQNVMDESPRPKKFDLGYPSTGCWFRCVLRTQKSRL